MNRKASWAAVTRELELLTTEELLAIIEKPGRLKRYAKTIVAENAANTYVTHLNDVDVPEEFHDAKIAWRKLAIKIGYIGPVAWKVRAGFSVKLHANLVGPCYRHLDHLQDCEFSNYEPTKDAIVFCIPRMAEGSTNKKFAQMEVRREKLRQRYGLPAHHCQSNGSISLLFALIFANFKRTGDKSQLQGRCAVSDTITTDGCHMFAGIFGDEGLHCDPWNDEFPHEGFGFFLLGIEELKK